MKRLLSLLIISIVFFSFPLRFAEGSDGELRVHFIDVGQADSILVQSPRQKNILIDMGDEHSSSKLVSYLKEQNVDVLDALIITHPHHDHIGAAEQILNHFKIRAFYMPALKNKTKTYKKLRKALDDEEVMMFQAKAGDRIEVEKKVKLKIIAPLSKKYGDMNEHSYVIRLVHGKNTFLLMGDAGEQSEADLMTKSVKLKADVLKVGHHGANTGTTLPFLKAVNPEYAVISVGRNNKYGFPDKGVLRRLKLLKIPIYRTDLMGTIIAESDGKQIHFKTTGFKQ